MMTLRERMLRALRHEIADEVTCCPDISIMVPLKMKNKPFWEFYIDPDNNIFYDIYNNENLFKAYVDTCKYFGIPAWCWYMSPDINQEEVSYKHRIVEKKLDRITVETTMTTPEGDLWSLTVYTRDNPPFPVRKYIKDFKRDFKFIKYFYPELKDIDYSPVLKEREYVGDQGVIAIGVLPPSLVQLDGIIDGGLGIIGMLYYDYPELISKYKDMHEEWSAEYLEKIIEAHCCDEILTGGSGLMTWQSPKITRDLSLDGLKKITNLCKRSNLISHVHCCGFEKELVNMCAEETDLDVIEPLETLPQGDCDLKEIKKLYGEKLVLKGNISTSSVMLSDAKTVEIAAKKCLEDAAYDGGYILSTGDQCGRDTPHENIFKLVEVCKNYKY
ncbi:MAG: hypothetical protein M1308_16620 [Actinobacteria bacterium]|nr:hypothetical protein [Actinomycetota bacterium]